MRFLKITLVVACGILGLLAFIGWLAPQPAHSEKVTTVASAKPAAAPVANSSQLVHSTMLVDWNHLPDNIKSKISEHQLYYINGGWAMRDAIPFKRENAFYVKLKLDNQRLAAFSESEAFTYDKILADNPHRLYGKYVNQWSFDNQRGEPINPTEKFNGFSTIAIDRNGLTDEVWVGPIETRPATLKILAYQQRDKVYSVAIK